MIKPQYAKSCQREAIMVVGAVGVIFSLLFV